MICGKLQKNGPESKINDRIYSTHNVMFCFFSSKYGTMKVEKTIFFGRAQFEKYTALFVLEAVKFKDAVKLVKRAECMKAAPEGVMAAIIGIDYDDLKSVYDENKLTEVSIANINAPGQIVISGTNNGVKELSKTLLC